MDRLIVEWLNRFAQHSFAFDQVVEALTQSNLFKSGVLMAVWWGLWFTRSESAKTLDEVRSRLVATLAGGFVAVAVGRMLSLVLPFRVRPMHDESLHFVMPFGGEAERLDGWNSMPSDHAVLCFALVTGLWRINRRLGIALAIYVLLVVGFTRVYAGLHYPSDVLAGAAAGIVLGLVFQTTQVRRLIDPPVAAIQQRWTPFFYASLFLVTMEVSVMLWDIRGWGRLALDILRNGFAA